MKVRLYLIILLVAIPQLSETIYVSSLPEMAKSFSVNNSIIELTLTMYLLGFGFGVSIWGGLSDRLGRKPIVLVGLLIYILSCIGCFVSKSISHMFFFRFIQAFGASVGSVIGQAIARDAINAKNRGAAFSLISMAIAFAPALGLVIGSLVIEYFEWYYVFITLIIIGLVTILLIIYQLPETNNIKMHQNLTFYKLYIKCFKKMIKDRIVLGYGFLIGAVNGILFGYFAESPFFFKLNLKMSNHYFGLLSFFIFIPLLIGSATSKYLLHKNIDHILIIRYGIFLILISSFIFLTLIFFNIISIKNYLISCCISFIFIYFCIVGVAIIIPNALSNALQNYGDLAGTASSIFGFYYYSIIALMTYLMSYLHDNSLIALPKFLFIQGFLMYFIFETLIIKRKDYKYIISNNID